jgi:hypothetical protein
LPLSDALAVTWQRGIPTLAEAPGQGFPLASTKHYYHYHHYHQAYQEGLDKKVWTRRFGQDWTDLYYQAEGSAFIRSGLY